MQWRDKGSKHKRGKMLKCKWAACGHRSSMHNKSIFSKLRTEPLKILRILDCWMAGISSKSISFVARASKKIVRRVLSRLKKTLVPRYYTDISKIGEADHIIEIDESKFGKRKYNRGHSVEGVWVLGMVDRVTRKIYQIMFNIVTHVSLYCT